MKFAGMCCICLLVVFITAGCENDSGKPLRPQVDPLLGYWGLIYSYNEGGAEHVSDGTEAYWVIYSDQTVCLIEKLPSGDYQKDSTFIYESDGEFFTARFDLDPVPLPQPAVRMGYHFSAASDTLFMAWEAADSMPAGQMTMIRQDSIPECGCDP